MAINNTHFFHNTIAKITLGLGTIINNIQVQRKDDQDNVLKAFRVPVEQGSMEHWYKKLVKKQKAGEITTSNILPFITYQMTNFGFDRERQMPKLRKLSTQVYDNEAMENVRTFIWQPVPISLAFEVTIKTKYMTDSLQIIEQILPYFDPVVNLKITEQSDSNVVNDVAYSIIGDPSLEDNYFDGLEEPREITWTLQIQADTYLYKPFQEAKVIRSVVVDFDHFDPEYDFETLTVTAATGENEDQDNSTIIVTEE